MKLKNVLAAGLMAGMFMGFNGIASADVLDDVLTINQNLRSQAFRTSYIDDSGNKCYENYVTVFEAKTGFYEANNGDVLTIRLTELAGKKYALLDAKHYGSPYFYDYIVIGIGNKNITLKPINQHVLARRFSGEGMEEFLVFQPTKQQWQAIKNATSIRLENDFDTSVEVQFDKPETHSLSFKQAVDFVIKFTEK